MTDPVFAPLRQRLSSHTPRQANTAGRTEAAVAIVLTPVKSAQLELLLIKRAEVEGDPWSGQMAFPGGRREPRDAGLFETARRETLEEIGVDLPAESVLGALDDLAPMTPTLPPIVVRPYVFGLTERPQITLSTEVALHIWTPLWELPAQEGEAEIVIRGGQLVMPSYLVGPHVVWGMTHRIVKSLLDLAG